MSAHPLENTELSARYPHLLGAPVVQIEHLCPHCGEGILSQLAPERSLGAYTAQAWWHCPKCARQFQQAEVAPQSSQAEIDQCRREDEHRGQPGGGNSKSAKRGKALPRKERNHLQDVGGGSKDRSIVALPGDKFTNTSVSATNNEVDLARAYSKQLNVPISQVWRWGLAMLKHCGFCPDCQAPSPGEHCLTCGLDLERAEG